MKPTPPSAKHIALAQQATALRQNGSWKEAAAIYQKLLKYFPNDPQILAGYAIAAYQLGKYAQSIALLEKSLKISPNQPNAWSNLGNAWAKLNRPEPALASYEQTIALQPNHAIAHCNRGSMLQVLNQLQAALASFENAIAIKPDYTEAYIHLGNLQKELLNLDEALNSYNQAIALNPNSADGYWNKALLKLLTGDYLEGWRLYEWRWQGLQKNQVRNFSRPLWLGEESLTGKTLLIHAEQGYGDCIQFCRYALMLLALGAHVIIESPPELAGILASLKGRFTLVVKGQAIPDFDLHCPLLSLPLAFKTTLADIPATVPYLHADRQKVMDWQQRLGQNNRPRIGLAWSGSLTDPKRRIPLELLATLLAMPVEFHSLQKDILADDAKILSQFGQLHDHRDRLTDFAETAALIESMDLIISIDTAVAHLAGALGKPVWILLRYAADFRWLLARSDSPWYPTATLFRQSAIGDWDSVLAVLKDKLNTLFIAPNHETQTAFSTTISKLPLASSQEQ